MSLDSIQNYEWFHGDWSAKSPLFWDVLDVSVYSYLFGKLVHVSSTYVWVKSLGIDSIKLDG